MKKIYSSIAMAFLILSASTAFSQNNVGIGTNTPNPNAALDIQSTNQGVLVPRLTTAQRVAIANPTEGLMVYDIDANCFFFFESTAAVWANLCNAGGQGPAGPQGPQGAVGAQGPQGDPGVAGATGPAGPIGPAGPQGDPGVAGPQGPQGPAGSSANPESASLASSFTIPNATFVNIPGVSVTFTATKTSAFVMFTSSGYGYTNSMSYVNFRVMNGATSYGGSNTNIQNYDDWTGTTTLWNCSWSRNITGLTVGTTYTFFLQGSVNGIYGTDDAVIDPVGQPNNHHVTLTVFP